MFTSKLITQISGNHSDFRCAWIAAINLLQTDLDKSWNYLWYWYVRAGVSAPVMHPRSGVPVWDYSFETIHLKPRSFETTTFETTFIRDLLIRDHFIWNHDILRPVHLRPHSHETSSFGTTVIWDHIHLRTQSFETALIWDHIHWRPHSFETTFIWDHIQCTPR